LAILEEPIAKGKDHKMKRKTEQSEFGKGVVVCLAKFSEHLNDRWYEWAKHAAQWSLLSKADREHHLEEAKKFQHGDSARLVSSVALYLDTADFGLSHNIEMWMNGASDHFYDLDRTKAPKPLCELAALCLRIGHGFTGEKWDWKTVEKILQLWQDSCLAVDKKLGVESDWGQW
jgi:hypothetical protein